MPKSSRPNLAPQRRKLLRWYDAHRRDLPWRRTRDPYRIWVSEIMLQQTRVEAVIPYYERFLERFPDVQALATADTDTVLAAWSGLGYYRRARMLHEASRCIVRDHEGEFPADEDAVRALPGIGRYTAGAILSIAFEQRVPLLDGNVERVLCRLDALRGDPRRAPLPAKLWNRATDWADCARPGDVNQALMELGATVCLPAQAVRCDACPLRSSCTAHAESSVAELPELPARSRLREEHWGVILVERNGRVLCWQRTLELMHGLWELPTFVLANANARCASTALRHALQDEFTGQLELADRVTTERQAISGRQVHFHVHRARERRSLRSHSRTRWLYPRTLLERGITTATRRILRTLDGSAGARAGE